MRHRVDRCRPCQRNSEPRGHPLLCNMFMYNVRRALNQSVLPIFCPCSISKDLARSLSPHHTRLLLVFLPTEASACFRIDRRSERARRGATVEQGFLAKVPAEMRRRKFICSTEFALRASALHPFPPSTLWEDFVHATVFQGRTHKAAVAGRTGPCPTSLSLSPSLWKNMVLL